MYPNVICRTSDKSVANYRKNEEKQANGFKAPFSVVNLRNNNFTYNSTHKQFLYEQDFVVLEVKRIQFIRTTCIAFP